MLSLWEPVCDSGTENLESLIPDPQAAQPFSKGQNLEAIQYLMSRLNTRQQFVLYMICPGHVNLPAGFCKRDKFGHSVEIPPKQDFPGGVRYQAIADLLKLTKARIGQIVDDILAKARILEFSPASVAPPSARSAPPSTPAEIE